MWEKEPSEWSHSWFDQNDKHDLPRILLVGDSICCQYQEKVRELLKGVCYVDYYASSYAINVPLLFTFLKAYTKDVHYDLVHFNNGLHGRHITMATYERCLDKTIKMLIENSNKVVVAESMVVKTAGNKEYDPEVYERVLNKNERLRKVGEKYGLRVNPFYEASCNLSNDMRWDDGWHYNEKGAAVFAQMIADVVKEELKK